jgi:hypothetical protein
LNVAASILLNTALYKYWNKLYFEESSKESFRRVSFNSQIVKTLDFLFSGKILLIFVIKKMQKIFSVKNYFFQRNYTHFQSNILVMVSCLTESLCTMAPQFIAIVFIALDISLVKFGPCLSALAAFDALANGKF